MLGNLRNSAIPIFIIIASNSAIRSASHLGVFSTKYLWKASSLSTAFLRSSMAKSLSDLSLNKGGRKSATPPSDNPLRIFTIRVLIIGKSSSQVISLSDKKSKSSSLGAITSIYRSISSCLSAWKLLSRVLWRRYTWLSTILL